MSDIGKDLTTDLSPSSSLTRKGEPRGRPQGMEARAEGETGGRAADQTGRPPDAPTARSRESWGRPRIRAVRSGWRVAAFGILLLVAIAGPLAACNPLPSFLAARAGTAAHTLRPGRPVRLRIPAIGANMPVVPVGLDANGAMAAPQGPESSPIWHEGFWYDGGYLAGQPGNTVIAGHVDDDNGNLTPFAGITRLEPGDAIYVVTDHGDTIRFTVVRVAEVANPVGGPNDPTVTSVFGPSRMPNLNLITCAGTWVGNEFDQRLVVYATLGS